MNGFIIDVKLGTVNSPERMKPKKHKTTADYSIWVSLSAAFGAQQSLTLYKIAGVIGSRSLEGADLLQCVLLIPACTRQRRGRDQNCLGSGRPSVTCMCLIADKYVLIVWGQGWWHARCDA